MLLNELQPIPALRPFVKRFLVLEMESAFTSTLLPDTSLVLGFRFSGSGIQEQHGKASRIPNFVVSGLRDTVRKMSHTPGGILLTVFTETGASAFFREPLDSLYNDTVPFDCFVPPHEVRPLEDRIAQAAHPADRAAAMERFLLSHLRNPDPDPEVLHALAAIRRTNGNLRIEELAQRIGLSQSALERRFRKMVGTSPKKLSSVVRFRYALDLYPQVGDLAETAHEAGYFDQSHFAKDFKAFTGQSPDVFFRTPPAW